MEREESGMKLWEAMWFLEENPTDVYEAQLNDWGWRVRMTVDTESGEHYKFEVFNGEELVDQSHPIGAFNGNAALDLDWQLVRQPVTWQEAIQAWADGKVIRLAMPGWNQVLGPKKNIVLDPSRITNGTWYVED